MPDNTTHKTKWPSDNQCAGIDLQGLPCTPATTLARHFVNFVIKGHSGASGVSLSEKDFLPLGAAYQGTTPPASIICLGKKSDRLTKAALVSAACNLPTDPMGQLSHDQLHPELVWRLRILMERARALGLNVFLFEGFRSVSRQQKLYQQGRVTRARPGYSFHNYGLAADIVFYDKRGRPSWSRKNDWQTLGRLGKELGLTWGGDFSRIKDLAHFEFHPGKTISEVRAAYQTGGMKKAWSVVS